MQGCITTKDLFTQARTIVSEFGPRAYLKCIYKCFVSRGTVTFLECVY